MSPVPPNYPVLISSQRAVIRTPSMAPGPKRSPPLAYEEDPTLQGPLRARFDLAVLLAELFDMAVVFRPGGDIGGYAKSRVYHLNGRQYQWGGFTLFNWRDLVDTRMTIDNVHWGDEYTIPTIEQIIEDAKQAKIPAKLPVL